TSGLERPVGLRIPRLGREPDGSLLPLPCAALRPARDGDGLRGQPGPPHPLGRDGDLLGVAATGNFEGRVGSSRVFLGDVWVLLDSFGPSLELYHRLLDALGPGIDLVDPRARVPNPSRRSLPAEPRPGPPDLARSLSARVPDADHHRLDGGLVDRRARVVQTTRGGSRPTI